MLESFNHGRISILIGTSLVGSGIDMKGVDQVLHWRGAWGLISYIQHASRAGRAQNRARSTVLLSPEDLDGLQSSDVDKAALHRFLSTRECRRTILGVYFDGVLYPNCVRSCDELCDMCKERVGCSEEDILRAAVCETLTPPSLEWAWENSILDSTESPRQPAMSAAITHISESHHWSASSNASYTYEPSHDRAHSPPSSTGTHVLALQQSLRRKHSHPPDQGSATKRIASASPLIKIGRLAFHSEGIGFEPDAMKWLHHQLMNNINPVLAMQEAVEICRKVRQGCLYCWLLGFPEAQHGWEACPHLPSNEDVRQWRAAAKQITASIR